MDFTILNHFINRDLSANDIGVVGVLFVSTFFLTFLLQKLVLFRLRKFVEKTKNDLDDTILSLAESVRPGFYFYISLYIAFLYLDPIGSFRNVMDTILLVWIVYQIVLIVLIVIDFMLKKRVKVEGKHILSSPLMIIAKLFKGLVWIIAILFVFSNLGVDVASLIAGLGISGIAVALALQQILVDLFSSFAIYFDKPFIVGDFISVGNINGTVEKVGIKTTRIRSRDGEEVVISNSTITNSEVHNFNKLQSRRMEIEIGVAYETDPKKLRKIPQIIRKIISDFDDTTVDYVHMKAFGDFALLFEADYMTKKSTYADAFKKHEAILFEIIEKFEKENIVIAYPTQVIHTKSIS